MVGDHKVFQDIKSSPVPSGRWEVAEEQDRLEEEPLEGGRAQRTGRVTGSPAAVPSSREPQRKPPGTEYISLTISLHRPLQLLTTGKGGRCPEEGYGPVLSNRNIKCEPRT